MQDDPVEIIGQGRPASLAAQAREAVSERLGNGFGLGFTGKPGKRLSELFGLGVSDVQSDGSNLLRHHTAR
jgi:hypothetical protein